MRIKLFQPQILEKISKLFKDNQVIYAGVFGSCVKNQAKAKSDIDFLIEFKPGSRKTLFDMVDLQEQLKQVLKKNVDLVTKNSLNKYLKDEVIKTTITLYG